MLDRARPLDYSGPMTTTEEYMTEMTNALIEDAIDHAEEIGRSIPNEESAPDPAYAGMFWEEIVSALNEIALDEEIERQEREWQRYQEYYYS